jgi:hypothetical protein
MIGIHFSKRFAEQVIDALNNGKPIVPPDGKWTGNHMLALAGMLYAGVFSQGPHTHQLAGITQEMRERLPQEHREAIEETFTQDIHDGIEFVGTLFFKVKDNQYDQVCEPDVQALVYSEQGEKKVIPAKGFKGTRSPGG